MASTVLSLIAFLALVPWSFVFTGLRRRSLAREIAAPEEQHKNALERGLHIADLAGTAVIPDNRFENTSDDVRAFNRKDRAKTYLRRIIALTGTTQIGNRYVLDVGTARFHVRERTLARRGQPQLYIRGNLLLLRPQRNTKSGASCCGAAAT